MFISTSKFTTKCKRSIFSKQLSCKCSRSSRCRPLTIFVLFISLILYHLHSCTKFIFMNRFISWNIKIAASFLRLIPAFYTSHILPMWNSEFLWTFNGFSSWLIVVIVIEATIIYSPINWSSGIWSSSIRWVTIFIYQIHSFLDFSVFCFPLCFWFIWFPYNIPLE